MEGGVPCRQTTVAVTVINSTGEELGLNLEQGKITPNEVFYTFIENLKANAA
jgi:hypothetical protein